MVFPHPTPTHYFALPSGSKSEFEEFTEEYEPDELPENVDLAKEQKIKFICSLLQQAPPGEFTNVFEDLRILVQDDQLMRLEAAQVSAQHTRNNFTSVTLKGGNALVTRYNDLGGHRFFDPQIKLSFKFDHLSGRADKFLFHHDTIGDDAELWRATLNVALESYMTKHFLSGDCRVFKKNLTSSPFFVVCIEGHQYKPLDFWNGLWKSEWTFAFTPPATQIKGNIHLQIHYFKGANLHLTVNEAIEESITLINRAQFALDVTKLIEAEDNKFQIGLVEGLQTLSEEIWTGALRRQLPVTRTVIEWDKVLTSQSTEVQASGNDIPLSLLKCLL
ncbi:F-actin-capping protein subunit alpha-3 isoform X2 [Hemicordylus capensis]|uniref:F-actin-capping protein subunit alpha-3 isoform X2 n=1 Tax=Hemicordylus capensis TaxID=884348 RepID=UPI002304CDCD|nr:F-actin-capping protein subunit alpha-3 isoform X2 [Hemicordylus capensis]